MDPQNPEPEWAADKIMLHTGSKLDSIFEVLWKSGDKSWVPFTEIADTNLLDPYLEAQGAESMADLGLSSGSPPCDNPQIFLDPLQPSRDANPYKPDEDGDYSSSLLSSTSTEFLTQVDVNHQVACLYLHLHSQTLPCPNLVHVPLLILSKMSISKGSSRLP